MMRKDKGIALILAIIVVTMVSLLLTSYVAMTISERKRVEHESAAASADYIARAGLEKAFFDLSCEYEKDRSWINGAAANTINGISAIVPAIVIGTDSSSYQNFYPNPPIAFADGGYTVEISFVNNADDSAFLANRLWVRSTGTVTATGDSVILTQLARVKSIALVELDAVSQELDNIERLYDTLDRNNTFADSAVDTPTSVAANHEIRIAGGTVAEDNDNTVTIDKLATGTTLTIKGGYGFDFSDGSRNTSSNQSVLKLNENPDTKPVVKIENSGTVIMGGVRIE